MVKVKPQIEIDENEVEGVIRAYTKGKKSINWAVGKIRAKNLEKEKVKEIFNKVYSYSKINFRFQELQNKCRELNFL